MPKGPPERPGFRDWVDKQVEPNWPLLPLTHITKGLVAEDIVRSGRIEPVSGSAFKQPLAYFFYGRAGYRVSGEKTINLAAASPYCFVFKPELIRRAWRIFAFDTGAFHKRLFSHVLPDEINVGDFSLERDEDRPNKLISAVFGRLYEYFKGDRSAVRPASDISDPWDLLVEAYVKLLTSPGRNEPDDRICSIEVTFSDPVLLSDHLQAIIVPHTMWRDGRGAPWLEQLKASNVEIRTYEFIPGRSPAEYQSLMELELGSLFHEQSYL